MYMYIYIHPAVSPTCAVQGWMGDFAILASSQVRPDVMISCQFSDQHSHTEACGSHHIVLMGIPEHQRGASVSVGLLACNPSARERLWHDAARQPQPGDRGPLQSSCLVGDHLVTVGDTAAALGRGAYQGLILPLFPDSGSVARPQAITGRRNRSRWPHTGHRRFACPAVSGLGISRATPGSPLRGAWWRVCSG